MQKILKLDHELADLIRQGKKTSTWRLFDDKDLNVNDRISFIDKVDPQDKNSWIQFGEAIITSIIEKRIGDISSLELEASDNFSSQDDVLGYFRQFYQQEISYDTPLKIIHFDVVHTNGAKKNQKDSPEEIKLYADGGSRGNPGPSAGGFAILDMDDNVVKKSGKYLGITTNNQAEYHSLKGGIEAARDMNAKKVHVFMDSLLVVNQMKGIYKIKNRDLWPIHQAIKEIAAGFEEITFTHVPRELNKIADAVVNETLDEQ